MIERPLCAHCCALLDSGTADGIMIEQLDEQQTVVATVPVMTQQQLVEAALMGWPMRTYSHRVYGLAVTVVEGTALCCAHARYELDVRRRPR